MKNILYDSYLKKPIEVQMTGSRWIKYTYNGHGALLRRELSTGEVWDYVGNMILKNNQYYQINMPEGRVVYQNSAWHQEYEYRDQVGNLRVAFRARNDSLVMIQATDYTPFGVQFNNQLYSGAKQNYEYQGHESQPDHGLRRIMMGARCLNPTIGRFDGIDHYASAAPGWSSYRFAFNNPVMYTDPDGNFETSQYNSSTPVEVHGGTFNNGFREVSFRAAGYSVDYYDYSAKAEGEETSSETNKANAQNKSCCGEALGLLKTAEMTSELEGREFGDVLGEVHERHLTGEKILLKEIVIGLALSKGTGWLISGFKYLRALRAAETSTQSLGAGRTAVKQWLQSAGNLERGKLIQNIQSAGFKRMSPTTSPVSVFERGGMRIRLDPPQPGTPFNHMHLEVSVQP